MDNTTQSYSSILRELKELKKLNDELIAEKTEICDMAKILIAKISHEFKTPLNSIIGFTELLKYKTTDKQALEYINTISASSQYMHDLIKNIIDITSAQYNKLKLSYSIFNTKDVIENIIHCFNNDKIQYTLINQYICADYVRFKQVIYNLISNSIKFNNPQQNIEIITYLHDDFFFFEIKDNGNGIEKDNLKKIFDFFAQLPNKKFSCQMSSGIGLSLCKTIIDAHSGEIYVKSEIHKGSTFIFKLPIEKPE